MEKSRLFLQAHFLQSRPFPFKLPAIQAIHSLSCNLSTWLFGLLIKNLYPFTQPKVKKQSRDNAREETLVFCNQVLRRIVQFVPGLSMHDDNVNMIKCALDLYVQWILDLMNLYITKSLVYRTIFFTPVIAKYMEKEPQYNVTSVSERTQFASPLALRYIEVPL